MSWSFKFYFFQPGLAENVDFGRRWRWNNRCLSVFQLSFLSKSGVDQKTQNQAQIQATTNRPLDTVVTVAPCENASEPQSTEILEETCTRSEDCLDLEAQDSRSKSNTGASDRSLPCPAEDTQLIRTNRFNKRFSLDSSPLQLVKMIVNES